MLAWLRAYECFVYRFAWHHLSPAEIQYWRRSCISCSWFVMYKASNFESNHCSWFMISSAIDCWSAINQEHSQYSQASVSTHCSLEIDSIQLGKLCHCFHCIHCSTPPDLGSRHSHLMSLCQNQRLYLSMPMTALFESAHSCIAICQPSLTFSLR